KAVLHPEKLIEKTRLGSGGGERGRKIRFAHPAEAEPARLLLRREGAVGRQERGEIERATGGHEILDRVDRELRALGAEERGIEQEAIAAEDRSLVPVRDAFVVDGGGAGDRRREQNREQEESHAHPS